MRGRPQRRQSRLDSLLRRLGLRRDPPRVDEPDPPPDSGVREPRRPRPGRPSAGAAVLDPPLERTD